MVIILNGPSSSGKTALTNFITSFSDVLFIRLGIDQLWMSLPRAYVEKNAKAHLGFKLIPDGKGGLDTQTGVIGRQLKTTFMESIKNYISKGFNIIIEDVILSDDDMKYYDSLDPQDTFFIGVYCDKEEALRREKTRGDRPIGLVEGQIELVHRFKDFYDLIIDNTSKKYEQNASEILDFIKTNEPRGLSLLRKTIHINELMSENF